MNLLFLDTETTGFTHNRLVQLAWEHHPTGKSCVEHFFPPVEIEEGASKVHGKTMETVKHCPYFNETRFYEDLLELVQENITICHNAEYDLKVLANEGIAVPRHICTLKLARKMLPRESDHKLQGLYSRMQFVVPEGDLKAHDALGDVRTMIGLFTHLFVMEQRAGLTEDEILAKFEQISTGIPDTMPFGKHRGTPIKDLPNDYIAWIFKQDKFDESVLKAIRHYLPHLV